MTKQRHIITLGILLSIALPALLTSCSDDGEGDVMRTTHELHLSLGTQKFDMTRGAGDVPTDFELYNHAGSLAPISQIQGYMAYWNSDKGTAGSWDYVPALFNYEQDAGNSSDTWTSKVALKDGQYYFYGFMPKDAMGSTVTLVPYNDGEGADYANGAVLTLTGLNAVSPDDICIIVGAKGYGLSPDDVPDMTNGLGKFGYNTSDGENLFLLIDHLYAGLKFNLKLNESYSRLRKIKLNSISLEPDYSDGDVVETVNAVVTIVNNDDGVNPIVPIPTGGGNFKGGKVEFANGNIGSRPKPAVLYRGDGLWLTATDQPFLACFCPSTNTNFVLETNYDVYDRKDNLIRENQVARNRIKLQWNLTSGQIHTINITVNPTYLYVLSDPDLDNPTFDASTD